MNTRVKLIKTGLVILANNVFSFSANAAISGTYIGQINIQESQIEYVAQIDEFSKNIIYRDFRSIPFNNKMTKTEIVCKGKLETLTQNQLVSKKLQCTSDIGANIPELEVTINTIGNIETGEAVRTEIQSSHLRPSGFFGLFSYPTFTGLLRKYIPRQISEKDFLEESFRVRFASRHNERLSPSALDISAITTEGEAKIAGYLAGRDASSEDGKFQFGYGNKRHQPAKVAIEDQNLIIITTDDAGNSVNFIISLNNLLGKDLLQFMIDMERLSIREDLRSAIEKRYESEVYVNVQFVQTEGLTTIFSPSTSFFDSFFR